MKKIIISALVLSFGLTFAQKKEIAAAYKAIEANDVATTNAEITKADAILNGSTQLLEPATLEQYYYAKGLALLKSGKTNEGAEFLGKISDLGKSIIFTGKNAEKQKVYFVGKTVADASGITGLKEETYAPTTTGKLGAVINPILTKANDVAMKAYEAKDYKTAGENFLQVYNLLKAAGSEEKLYQYYAGLSFAQGELNDDALKVYTNLVNEGYNGVKTEYKAKNKKTGAVETLNKDSWDLFKKMGAASDFSDFTIENSENKEQEIAETYAALLINKQKYDDAIAYLDNATKKYPKNTKLSELQGNVLYKSGKTDAFIQNLKDVVAKNPSDKASWYNLGVLTSKDPAKLAEAEGYLKKALEIDPNYIPALQGLIYNVNVNGDDEAIKAIDVARKAKKTELFNKLLAERRARLTKAIPYAEKWFSLEPKNKDVVTLLKGLYQTAHNDAKFNEMKALEATMK